MVFRKPRKIIATAVGVLLHCSLLCVPHFGYAQMIVAHRGASFDAPENTLAAFREAWVQQADGIEGDFYLTADQEIVCIHDKDTQRTAARNLPVTSSSLPELRQLEVGAWKAAKFDGEPIPTFKEVLACVPADKTFVIELKSTAEIVPVLSRQLAEADAKLDNLLVISFHAECIARCKAAHPELRAHWLTGYKLDKQTQQMHPTVEEIARTLQACQADGLGTQADRQVVNEDFIAKLTASGMREFHVWTVDSPQDARYFQSLGAVGITTNRPALIRRALERAP